MKKYSQFSSPLIDAAICDLIAAITEFSDDFFDSAWSNLQDSEIEALVGRLLRSLAETLEGQSLQVYLHEIRLTEAKTEERHQNPDCYLPR